MTINFVENNIGTARTFSIVNVWKKPIAIFPDFINDQDYCRNFFDLGNNISGSGNDGFTIIDQSVLNRQLSIANNRFSLISESKEDLLKYYEKFLSKIDEDTDYKNLTNVSAYGINIQIELPLKTDVNSFLSAAVLKPNLQMKVSNLEYVINLQDGDYLNIVINAMPGSSTTLLAMINHHHSKETSLLSIDELISEIDVAIEKIKNFVINPLLN